MQPASEFESSTSCSGLYRYYLYCTCPSVKDHGGPNAEQTTVAI